MLLKKYLFIFLALVFISATSFSRDYYVDARGGNNSNSGQSPATAWKSISRVNTMSFAPGDRILFKRGEIWQENTALVIKKSGTSSSRIVYGAYGTGNKPIISLRSSVPGWKSSGSWSNQGNSVWRYKFPYPWKSSHKLRRLWLDGKEYSISAGNSSSANNLDNLDGGSTTYGTNSIHRFYSYVSNGTLYLYVWTGGTNPASYYSTMEYSGVVQSDGTMNFFTVSMSDADYVTLENLDLRGGLYGSIGLRGSDYAIIDNCSFGKYSQYVGVMCASGFIIASDQISDNGIIRNCIIDSDFREKFYLQYSEGVGVQFGIASISGAKRWKFHNNKILRWAIGYLDGNDQTTTTNSEYNEFFNNDISYPEGTYAKGAQFNGSGTFPKVYAKVYNNNFHDLTAGINICGSNIDIQHNVFRNIRPATNGHASSSNSGYGIQIVNGGFKTYLDNNIISNNLFNNLVGWVMLFASNNVWFENNLMINCRTQSNYKYYIQIDNLSRIRLNNNIFYSDNATTSTQFLNLTGSGSQYTVSRINGISESSTSETNRNLQFTGSLSNLINLTSYQPASGSPAINSGLTRSWSRSRDYYGNSVNGSREIGPVEYGGTVVISNSAPSISSSPVLKSVVGQLYSYDVNASGTPAPIYKLTNFPSGMTINSSTGLIQWKPSSVGNYNVTVQASNGISPVDDQSFVINVTQTATTVSPSGAISYWKLDEKSGSTYTDQIGTNHARAISVPVPVSGRVSGAQRFTGTSKINVPANSSFNFRAADNFSIEFWYYGTSTPSAVKSAIGRYIPEKNARWWVGLNESDGRARFFMSDGKASAVVYGTKITDGKWHHVAATRNGSNGTLKIYVDGILRSTATKEFTTDFSSTSSNLNIGWLSLMDAYTLSGTLDEIAIHRVELAASVILKHYNEGVAGRSYFTLSGNPYVMLNSKILLQGPFVSGTMNTTLRTNSVLPLAQPYNKSPWNYHGTETVTSVPSDVVDWILVELRSNTTASTTIRKRAGFIKKDGSIVDLDGISKLKFDGIISGDYYIVIKHRNHLDVMSSSAVSLSSGSSLYDFTTAASKAYGTNSLVSLGSGLYGMISGDGDANGLINILDYGSVTKTLNQSGYLQGDLDMNKVVDARDFQKSASELFKSSKVPQ